MAQINLEEIVTRIYRMEACFDALLRAAESDILSLSEAPLRAKLRELLDYYDGGQWLRDYELDEQGLLPKDLKRGVLSQDGVFNLLAQIASETDPGIPSES